MSQEVWTPPAFYYLFEAGGKEMIFAEVGCQLKCKALYKKGDEGTLGKHVFSRDALITLLKKRPSDAMATNFY